ncbi:MAG: relaxase/mobilization nuclease domain-containing protein [Acutalibacteraceae bacterium]
MATFTAISEKTQTATAMKRVLDYVMQDKKTVLGSIKLVSGQNCVPESAFEEFMATKHRYGKAKGVFFKQYVQSFKPDCGAMPEQINQIGLETAKAFDGFEVVVATHIDRDHWHNHFVVNSVNCETGLKIQINEKGLEELRHKPDEICQQFGLEILKPYQKPKQRSLNQREYRAALRGNSKKLKLTNAIDYAVAKSRNKKQFIEQMQKLGYGVKWIDHYKYITYTTPDGQRFRDNRLLDDKYLKTNMEELFAYEYGAVKTNQQNTNDNRADGRSFDRADTADLPDAQARAIQSIGGAYLTDWERHCAEYGFDIQATDAGRLEEYNDQDGGGQPVSSSENCIGGNELDTIFSRGTIIESDQSIEGNDAYRTEEYKGRAESTGLDTLETQAEMGGDWLDIAANSLYLAADLAMIGGTDNDKHNPKYVRERKRGQKKKQTQDSHDDGGMQMNM